MTTWQDLERELDCWLAEGRLATIWWRDDDAAEDGPALERLLGLAASFQLPLHLATVPAKMGTGFAAAVRQSSQVRILQHGFLHQDHLGVPGKGASELGPGRSLETCVQDLREGWRLLESAGLPSLLPVLVPPWNRIAEDLLPRLPALGYRVLSTFGVRGRRFSAEGLLQVNCHVDPIKWRGGARFCGEASVLSQLVRQLTAQRQGRLDPGEPCGFLSHHLDSDEATWGFMERFFAFTRARAGLRWVSLDCLMDEEMKGA